MLKRVLLPKNSVPYIEQELSSGGYLSCQLAKMDLKNGEVETYLPSKLVDTTKIDFAESLEFLTGEAVTASYNLIINDIILDFLNNDPTKYAIFETVWNEKDPIVSKRSLQFFTINGVVYDFLKGDDGQKDINKYILDAQDYPTVISLIDIQNKNIAIKPQCSLDNGMVLELINQTVGLLIGAFDGEGYLFWKKSLNSPK
jgi:hypothetical protein